GARRDVAGHQPKAGIAVGVQRQHRMQQQAAADPLADLAQPAPVLGRGFEIDLAGVLDRQHMPASRCNSGLLAPARQQGFQAHPRIVNKSAISNSIRPLALGRMPKARTRGHDNAFELRPPPLSRRRSPNRPNRYCSSNIAAPLPNRSAANRITPNPPAGTLKPQPESIRRTKM